MTRHNHPEAFERLRQLAAQLHAVTMVSATEDFSLWHPEIREPYMYLVTEMSREMRDGLQKLVSSQPEQQKRRRGY